MQIIVQMIYSIYRLKNTYLIIDIITEYKIVSN